jgi:hypothetical protein
MGFKTATIAMAHEEEASACCTARKQRSCFQKLSVPKPWTMAAAGGKTQGSAVPVRLLQESKEEAGTFCFFDLLRALLPVGPSCFVDSKALASAAEKEHIFVPSPQSAMAKNGAFIEELDTETETESDSDREVEAAHHGAGVATTHVDEVLFELSEWRRQRYIEAIGDFWRQLRARPQELLTFPMAFRADHACMLAALRKTRSEAVLDYAHARLLADKQFMMEAVRERGCALRYASRALKEDAEIVKEATRQNRDALRYAYQTFGSAPPRACGRASGGKAAPFIHSLPKHAMKTR